MIPWWYDAILLGLVAVLSILIALAGIVWPADPLHGDDWCGEEVTDHPAERRDH